MTTTPPDSDAEFGHHPARHASTTNVTRWFDSSHLPAHLRKIAGPCEELADQMLAALPDSPELTVGLRKLLEAKDAFVRCAVAAHEDAARVATTDRLRSVGFDVHCESADPTRECAVSCRAYRSGRAGWCRPLSQETKP